MSAEKAWWLRHSKPHRQHTQNIEQQTSNHMNPTPGPFETIFVENYYNKLLTPNGNNPVRNRADGFLKIFNILETKLLKAEKNNEWVFYPFKILETGCMRADHGEMCFGDDGCATFLFDLLVNRSPGPGELISVDINPDNVEYARTKVSERTTLFCADSVEFLWKIPPTTKFALIYLDSFDIEKDNPHPSQLHHLKELCAVMKNTKPGTIIAVDDHDAFFTGGLIGKGNYVKDFMLNIGAEIVHEGYQIIFKIT